MSFVLTVHFLHGVQDIFLPNVDNRQLSMELYRRYSGFSEDIPLSFEVFDGKWSLLSNKYIAIDGRKQVDLSTTKTIHCTLLSDQQKFAILVQGNYKGLTEFTKYLLMDSPIVIGAEFNCVIQYNEGNMVSTQHAVLQKELFGTATVTDYDSKNGTFLNGKRINGKVTLKYGDTISIINLKIVWLGDIIAINQPQESFLIKGIQRYKPDDYMESNITEVADEFYQRSPRQVEPLDRETITIEQPPALNQSRKSPLWMSIGPSVTMVIPMSIGALLTMWSSRNSSSSISGPFMYMGIITSVTAAFIGVFWATSRMRYEKKQERELEKTRQNRYRVYLEKIRQTLLSKHNFNRDILCKVYPYSQESLRWSINKSRRVWERNINHTDFLTIRLGMGDRPSPNEIAIPKEHFSMVDDELSEQPSLIKKEFEWLRDVPICMSLQEHNLIGVISDSREKSIETARIIASQIGIFHSYTDVKMVFIYSEKDNWDFAKWFPHTWSTDGTVRLVANDKNSVGEVLYYLSGTLRDRIEIKDIRGEAEHPYPMYVIFIADPLIVENEAAMKYILAPTPEMGISTVLLYDRIDRLPNNCTVIIQRDEDYSGFYSLDNTFVGSKNVKFDSVNAHMLDEVSRALSGFKVREALGSGAVPRLLTFLDMYKTSKIEDINVYKNWQENRTYENMRAIIGHRGGGAPLYLDINEKYHGPHGLVAGFTGSGKSEVLQSYILSLSVNFHPHEVSFILIDYKGGGMALSFKELPHVAGIITNLGGNQTNRALASINSEIKRRQSVFNEFSIKHIDEYIELFRAKKATEPMPHLIIIADEFAELKKEQPDFVRALVSASRVGRSLGVHLILATQKPGGGVVDDEIWSNSKFRICLRVQDKTDSNDMIHRPDAAKITNVGRGFFQVGNDEIFEEFQSGWSGAKYEPDIPYKDDKNSEVKMINIWGKPCVVGGKKKTSSEDKQEKANEEKKKVTQLENITKYLSIIAHENGISPIENIWLPPLPTQLFLSDLDGFESENYLAHEINPFVGLIDDPVHQQQRPVRLNFTEEGHVFVCGSGASGKTTFLQTVLFSLVTKYNAACLNIYIADFGSRTLGVFSKLPHVGGVVFDDDPDKVNKLMALLVKELHSRVVRFSECGIGTFKEYSRLYDDTPAVVFVIDNFAGFTENNPKQEDNMMLLARRAASYGIYMLIASNAPTDMRAKMRDFVSFGVGLQMSNRFEYEAVLGRQRLEITAEDHTPGRGLICSPDPIEFQTAICLKTDDMATISQDLLRRFEEITNGWLGKKAPTIPTVPSDMRYEAFSTYVEVNEARSKLHIAYGYDMDEAQLVTLDPANLFCYSIGGQSRVGKTNLLKVLAQESKVVGFPTYIIDSKEKQLKNWVEDVGFEKYITTSEELFDLMMETIIPEFTRRREKIREYGGDKFIDKAMSDETAIMIFINSMSAFVDLIYNSKQEMKGFFELMTKSGNKRKIIFVACVIKDDVSFQSKPFVNGFVSWKEGIYLGGQTDNQKLFDFELPHSERNKKTSAGIGHINENNRTIKVVTPFI